MNFQDFRQKPFAFKILLAICLLVAAYFIFSSFSRMSYSTNMVRPLSSVVLWIVICIGFVMTKKWAWAAIFALISFSVLAVIHTAVSRAGGLNFYLVIPLALSGIILWLLNVKSMRNVFRIDQRKERALPPAVTNFAVFCLALSLFLFVGILGMDNLPGSVLPVRLFIGFLGFVYLLLGIGLWRLNTYAFKAVLSLLIFTAISITIILIHDYVEVHRFMALQKTGFYLLIMTGMILYWVKMVRPKHVGKYFEPINY